MPRYAVVRNDEVVNVILADTKAIADSVKPDGSEAVNCDGTEVSPGWQRQNGKFIDTRPAPPTPAPTVNPIMAVLERIEARLAALERRP